MHCDGTGPTLSSVLFLFLTDCSSCLDGLRPFSGKTLQHSTYPRTTLEKGLSQTQRDTVPLASVCPRTPSSTKNCSFLGPHQDSIVIIDLYQEQEISLGGVEPRLSQHAKWAKDTRPSPHVCGLSYTWFSLNGRAQTSFKDTLVAAGDSCSIEGRV